MYPAKWASVGAAWEARNANASELHVVRMQKPDSSSRPKGECRELLVHFVKRQRTLLDTPRHNAGFLGWDDGIHLSQ